MEESQSFWKKCNACKKAIAYSAKYWVCNVSTCNRKRTGLVFCEVSCWDSHLPFARHRESWAEERKAPTHEQWRRILAGEEEENQKPKAASKPATSEGEPSSRSSNSAKPSDLQAPAKVILRRTPKT